MSEPHPMTRREVLKAGALLVVAASAACARNEATPGPATATPGAMGHNHHSHPTSAATRAPVSVAPATAVPQPTLAGSDIEAAVPLDIIVWNRLAFGPRPGDLVEWRSRNAAPEAVFAQWLEGQLYPETLDDSECDARLAAAGFTTLHKSPEQIWADHVVDNDMNSDDDWQRFVRPMTETVQATLLRMTHSRRQLYEVVVDFWHNHFNVFRETESTPPLFMAYDRDAIRAHVFGNFRDMLTAVATSPAMLYYLDNYNNQVAGPNENWARELFELHTLGAENYFGVRDPKGVPKLANGIAAGYVDNDVYEAARAFTGWRVGDNSWGYEDAGVPGTGAFYFHRPWHDRFNKLVLGQYLPHDQADMKDGLDVLAMLAAHPGTARFVCRKLCRRLISDSPPESVVQRAAEIFLERKDAPDQLRHVVREIALSEEFKTTWGEKIKRPLEAVASLLRALEVDMTQQPDSLFWYVDGLGQPLFGRRPPDGYPDRREAWSSTNGLLNRWNFGVALIEGWISDESGRALAVDLRAQTPPELNRAAALADYWIDRLLGRPLQHAADRDALARFIAGEYGLDDELPADHLDWRLPGLVELILMSPDFQLR